MRLFKLTIEGYKSIKTPQELVVDPNVTVLIGANDHGKSNVLYAIKELNAEWVFTEGAEDRHWDLICETLPSISWCFELDDHEIDSAIAVEYLSLPDDESASAKVEDFTASILATRGRNISYHKSGYGSKHVVRWGGEQLPSETANYLISIRPTVELFSSNLEVIDAITQDQLDDPKFEFMKGIFMKAGLWERRSEVFAQTPRTSRALDEASARLTKVLQSEWEQGKDLSWRFKHRGNSIVLEIQDPAVSETYIRPSQRSTGFTSFFVLALTIHARIASNPARSRIFLFDEPGTYLHPIAQINLQRVFETLAERTQIIYSTHSLFLVNKNSPSRNKVIRKTEDGTTIDRRPYHRNWKSVRESLGILLSQNFLIADRTLLVEGPSDEIYLLSILSFLVRRKLIDIDLNDFSIVDAGTSSNQLAMAKLMLEDGRKVMVLVDGDSHGDKIKRDIARIAPQQLKDGSLVVQSWPKGASVEDLLISNELYQTAILNAAELLVTGGVRRFSDNLTAQQRQERLASVIGATGGTITRGRSVADETERWFKEKDAVSKLLIAEQYEILLRESDLSSAVIDSRLIGVVKKIITVLDMHSRKADRSILQASGSE